MVKLLQLEVCIAPNADLRFSIFTIDTFLYIVKTVLSGLSIVHNLTNIRFLCVFSEYLRASKFALVGDPRSMSFLKTTAIMASLGLVLFALLLSEAEANQIGICMRNCILCKKMLGNFFEGHLCADTCLKYKGKMIPDCEDIASISPFLNKYA